MPNGHVRPDSTFFVVDGTGFMTMKRASTTRAGVASCGFLFGIIPGVVALVLDASNHTLYYSASEVSFVDGQPDLSKMVAIHLDSMDEDSIAEALSRELGREVAFSDIQF